MIAFRGSSAALTTRILSLVCPIRLRPAGGEWRGKGLWTFDVNHRHGIWEGNTLLNFAGECPAEDYKDPRLPSDFNPRSSMGERRGFRVAKGSFLRQRTPALHGVMMKICSFDIFSSSTPFRRPPLYIALSLLTRVREECNALCTV